MSKRSDSIPDSKKLGWNLMSIPAGYKKSKSKKKYPASLPQYKPELNLVLSSDDEEEEQIIDRYETKQDDPESDVTEDSTIHALRSVIHKQAQMIQKLDHELLQLREKTIPKCTCEKSAALQTDDMLAYINCKVDLLTEQVTFIANKVSRDRRCGGYCVKHVRTKKCLCRGFENIHRCCGRVGSICDC